MRTSIIASILGVLASLAIASSALATDCTNASKSDPAAGAQILIDGSTGALLWATPGVIERLQRGVIDPTTGEGFHGLIALDVSGDGLADVSTWFGVGPDGDEIPLVAQVKGPACRGLTSLSIYFTQCL
jgi:hypothetical protein